MAGGLKTPSAIEQEGSRGQRTHLLARRRLRYQQHRHRQQENEQNQFHSVYLWAIGKRRPMPKALVVTFSPGAACWRLYSLRSTLVMMFRTRSSGRDNSSAMRRGAWFSST